MKIMKSSKTVKRSIAVAMVVIVVLVLATFKRQLNDFGKKITIIVQGESEFVTNQLLTQYPGKNGTGISNKLVETSVLPLSLKFFRLGEKIDFALEGGSLAASKNYLFLVDRVGNIYIKKSDEFRKITTPKINNNIAEYLTIAGRELNGGQMRVYSAAFDEEKSQLFLCYTKYVNKKSYQLVVDRIDLDLNVESAVGEWVSVFKSQMISASQSSVGGGGRLLLQGINLYVSIGYPNSVGYPKEWMGDDWHTGDANKTNSQDEKSSFGKIFSINTATNAIELISIGHRNVQGLTTTRSGQLFSVEHGPQGGDEVNLIEKDKNYGWPIKSYGTRYGTYDYDWAVPSVAGDKKIDFSEPIFSFVPSVGTSSIYSVQRFNKRWDGDILVGALKGQSIYRLHLSKNNSVVFSEPIWIGSRIRDIASHEDGVIYVLTDDGQLISITLDEGTLAKNTKSNGLHFEKELKVCQTCHSFEVSTPGSMAPSLSAIVNRKIGTDNFFKYTDAMKNKDGVWTQESLTSFLIDPQTIVPGTTMPKLGLSKSEAKKISEILAKK